MTSQVQSDKERSTLHLQIPSTNQNLYIAFFIKFGDDLSAVVNGSSTQHVPCSAR
jgi:hypothetical protein